MRVYTVLESEVGPFTMSICVLIFYMVSVSPSANVDGCVLRNSTTGSRPGSGSGCGLLIPHYHL